MSDKLIFLPFASVVGRRTGVNMENVSNSFQVYCKNLCVALVSLKKHNQNCDVALVTNTEIPKEYIDILVNNNILILHVEYDTFVMPDDYAWSLAFYKLCALNAMVSKYDYKYLCYTDVDIVANDSLDCVWKECDHNIMLYDINHGLQVPDYKIFNNEVNAFLSQEVLITHYGGEFFAANAKNAALFLAECKNIYEKIIESGFETTRGDEFIISLAAYNQKVLIKNAGAYIYRFWTGSFRLISTCHIYNAVSILHLPREKTRGLVHLYDRCISKGKFPSSKKIYRICYIDKPALTNRIKKIVKKLIMR